MWGAAQRDGERFQHGASSVQQQAARAELLLDAQGAREICGAPRLWAKVVGEGQSQFFVMMWCEKSKERGKKKKT